ncbi:MAG: sugar phosphate isomerase/epimerase family protein [Anaerovoracaceae bacterium]
MKVKNNSFGICEWFLAVSGPAAIRMAGELGYDGIQIDDLGGPSSNWALADKRIQQMYLDAQEKYGVKIQCMTPISSMMRQGGIRYAIDSSEGITLMENFRKILEICKSMKIDTIVLPGCDESAFLNEDEERNTCRFLKILSDISSDEGIQFVYESFGTTDKTLKILDYAGENLKLCYDILNPIRRGFADPLVEIRQLDPERIDCVHVKDAFEHMKGTCLLGTGAAGVTDSLEALHEIGYRGWYISENFYYLPPMSDQGNGWDMAEKDLKFMKEKCK